MTRNRTVAAAFVGGLVLLLGACTPAPSIPTTPWQDQMVASINAERAAAGHAPLTRCATLDVAAQRHSEDQAARSTMTHTGSDGSGIGDRATSAGYRGWTALAENVAAGQSDVPSVMSAWMASSGHRTNILGGYAHVGVGLARSANGTPYWTQDFGTGGDC